MKGGTRAGRRRATETDLSAGDQEMKVQMTRKALGQLPSAWVIGSGYAAVFVVPFLAALFCLAALLGTLRAEFLLHGFANLVHINAMPLCRGDQHIGVAGWRPICAFQQNDLDQQF